MGSERGWGQETGTDAVETTEALVVPGLGETVEGTREAGIGMEDLGLQSDLGEVEWMLKDLGDHPRNLQQVQPQSTPRHRHARCQTKCPWLHASRSSRPCCTAPSFFIL